MPGKSEREAIFIAQFLSAYEHDTWADADLDWLDQRVDGAVEVVARRKSDGLTLAIEHTIIEPFVDEKRDAAAFLDAGFLKIEEDRTLPVPGRYIRVFVPVGILPKGGKKTARAFTNGLVPIDCAYRIGIRNTLAQSTAPETHPPVKSC